MDTSKWRNFTKYELLIVIAMIILLFVTISSLNLYFMISGEQQLIAFKLFVVSITMLLLSFFGLYLYNEVAQPYIAYEYTKIQNLGKATFIVVGAWLFNLLLYKIGIYDVSIASTISPQDMLNILGLISSGVYVILIALLENLIFVTSIPVLVLTKIFHTDPDHATNTQILIASLIGGVLAALYHLSVKPEGALINTIIYFTSWAYSTLILRSSVLADLAHSLGNALGLLYSTINYTLYLT